MPLTDVEDVPQLPEIAPALLLKDAPSVILRGASRTVILSGAQRSEESPYLSDSMRIPGCFAALTMTGAGRVFEQLRRKTQRSISMAFAEKHRASAQQLVAPRGAQIHRLLRKKECLGLASAKNNLSH